MTNKDYERLTIWDEELQRPCMTDDGSNERTFDIVMKHVDRLYELENAIENGTLVFLPCNIGDKFWWIYRTLNGEINIREEEVWSIDVQISGVWLRNYAGYSWVPSSVYFTRKEAEKALEEIKK